MGAYKAGSDATIDAAIARHGEILDFLKQKPKDRIDMAHSSAELIERFGS